MVSPLEKGDHPPDKNGIFRCGLGGVAVFARFRKDSE